MGAGRGLAAIPVLVRGRLVADRRVAALANRRGRRAEIVATRGSGLVMAGGGLEAAAWGTRSACRRQLRRLVDKLAGLAPGLRPTLANGRGAGLVSRLVFHRGPP